MNWLIYIPGGMLYCFFAGLVIANLIGRMPGWDRKSKPHIITVLILWIATVLSWIGICLRFIAN